MGLKFILPQLVSLCFHRWGIPDFVVPTWIAGWWKKSWPQEWHHSIFPTWWYHTEVMSSNWGIMQWHSGLGSKLYCSNPILPSSFPQNQSSPHNVSGMMMALWPDVASPPPRKLLLPPASLTISPGNHNQSQDVFYSGSNLVELCQITSLPCRTWGHSSGLVVRHLFCQAFGWGPQ